MIISACPFKRLAGIYRVSQGMRALVHIYYGYNNQGSWHCFAGGLPTEAIPECAELGSTSDRKISYNLSELDNATK